MNVGSSLSSFNFETGTFLPPTVLILQTSQYHSIYRASYYFDPWVLCLLGLFTKYCIELGTDNMVRIRVIGHIYGDVIPGHCG